MRTQHTLHSLSAFPVYSSGFVSDTRVILGGGGGTSRSGVRNKLRMYDIQDSGRSLELVHENELERGEDAPMTIAVHPEDRAIVLGANEDVSQSGKNEHCRLYRVADNTLSLERRRQILPTKDLESYQVLTTFSRDFSIIAVGTSNNEVNILSYPTLIPVVVPFQVPSGILYGLDFSETSLLIITSNSMYIITLPITLLAKGSANDNTDVTIELPTLSVNDMIKLDVPTQAVLGVNEDGGVRTWRAGRFDPADPNVLYAVVNSAPPPGRSSRGARKVERRAFLISWQLSTTEKSLGIWSVRKVRSIGKRAVTVFTVSENGKLGAYGASDSSVCIVDTKTFAPLLEILKSHDFPPTLLQFNASAKFLVSGSADATVRVIVVPEFTTSSRLVYIVLLLAVFVAVIAIFIRPS